MFDKILIPTDFSDCSKRALEVGLRLADGWGSEVMLLHASEDLKGSFDDYVGVENADALVALQDEHLRRMAQAEVERVFGDKARVPAGRIGVRVASGAPAAQILEVAQEVGADLIVIGTHGRSGLTDTLLGSTAERVSRRSQCSVFTVKPEGFPFLRS